MKSFTTAIAAIFALAAASSAAIVEQPALPRATPAPARRQSLSDGLDFGDLSSLLGSSPQSLSEFYASATSALEAASRSGIPASLYSEQRSSLDNAFSSAFAALSSVSNSGININGNGGSSTSASSGGNNNNNNNGNAGFKVDAPVGLALGAVGGLVAAVFVL